MKISKGPACLW